MSDYSLLFIHRLSYILINLLPICLHTHYQTKAYNLMRAQLVEFFLNGYLKSWILPLWIDIWISEKNWNSMSNNKSQKNDNNRSVPYWQYYVEMLGTLYTFVWYTIPWVLIFSWNVLQSLDSILFCFPFYVYIFSPVSIVSSPSSSIRCNRCSLRLTLILMPLLHLLQNIVFHMSPCS